VVNISQVVTVNKSDLSEKIGSLPSAKKIEIIDGIKLLIESLPDPRP
jgi:mRNA interferase MazF